MIVTELYNGQGLGNQLWCYIVTRIIAKNKNYDFGIMSKEKFKGKEFLNLDFGKEVIGGSGREGGPPTSLPNGIEYYYSETMTRHPRTYLDISKRDDILLNVPDNIKIDGNMQSFEYVQMEKDFIKECIKVKDDKNITDYSDNNICIIHIRGGDFLASSAFLHSDYYINSVNWFKKKNPNMVFYIVTDDVNYAKKLCPDFEIVGGSSSTEIDSFKADHHIGGPIWKDWTIILNAKNLIISASSFSWWPTWLGDCENVIAPMYWADYKCSDGYWSCGDSLIPNWIYLNRDGQFKTYEQCLLEKLDYEKRNHSYWIR